jgi:hypothetical protein
MQTGRTRLRSYIHIAGCCGCLWILSGCSVIGPQSIANGRAAYNEVINQTEDQQMLMAIVRNRYGETISMLAVDNVTANIRFTAAVEAQFGIGARPNYETNLIPLSTGLSYEEAPIITYSPIEGEEQFDRLMSPVPISILVIFARSIKTSRLPFLMIIRSINDLRNPDFVWSPLSEPDPRFLRLLDLMIGLNETGHVYWARDPDKEDQFDIVIRDHSPKRTPEVRELLTLLGHSQKMFNAAPIVLPIYHAMEKPASGGVAVTTCSIFELIEILSAAVAVPEKHSDSGLATMYPPPGLAGKAVRILRARERPANASVAVKYRHSWFYIEETDQATKLMFRILRALWKDRIAATTQRQSAPLLTIPVGQ